MLTRTTTPAAELAARLNAEDPKWFLGDDHQKWVDLEHHVTILTSIMRDIVADMHALEGSLSERAEQQIAKHNLEGFDPLVDVFAALTPFARCRGAPSDARPRRHHGRVR